MDWYQHPIIFLIVGAILLAASGCGVTPSPDETPAAEAPSDLAIVPGMEIGLVVTTAFGLVRRGEVEPDVPGGGTLVTVQDVEPGQEVTVSWRRTVEQETQPDAPTPMTGIGTPTPTPVAQAVSEEGRIVATGLDQAHDVLPPLYWRPGAAETDTGLIWLSQEAFTELSETRRTRWSPDVLTRFSRLSQEMVREIEQKTDEDQFFLNAEADFVDYELSVNERQVTLRAIKAYDDFGNEYIILANERNPLVVKFTFNAVSTGVIGVDAAVWTLIKATFSGYQVIEISVPRSDG